MKLMKKIVSLAGLSVLLVIAFKLDLCAAIQRTSSSNNGVDLIQQTCRHTDDFNLCVQLLQSDPRSLTADVKGLAGIMLQLSQKNSKHTLIEVKGRLQEPSLDPEIKKCFLTCVTVYDQAITSYIPEALRSLQSNSYADARKEASDAFTTIQTCGRELFNSGGLAKEPKIVDMNKFDQHLVSLSLDIIYLVG